MIDVYTSSVSEQIRAGQKVGPGKYVCIDCGKALEMTETEQDLRKCPVCSCEIYNCLPGLISGKM